MTTTSDARAGGAYVEAYVKTDRLDEGLQKANQKVRREMSIMKTLGGAGHAAVSGVGSAFHAVTSRMTQPRQQGPTKIDINVDGITAGVKQLGREIQSLTPATNKFMSRFTGSIPEAAANLGTLHNTLKTLLPPAMAQQFDDAAKRIGDSGRTGSSAWANAWRDNAAGKMASTARTVAIIFGDKAQAEMARQARRISDAAKIKFSFGRSFSEGLVASGVIATRRLSAAGIGAGVSLADKMTLGFTGRIGRGMQGAMRYLAGKKLSEPVDGLGTAAKKATGPVQGLANATNSVAASAAKVGSSLSLGWGSIVAGASALLGMNAKMSAGAAVSAKQAASAMGMTT